MSILIVAVLMAALAVGCGSGDSSSSSESSSTADSASSTADSGSGSGATGASAEFVKPGSKNTIVKFGKEASAAEREAASQVLTGNLQARAAGNWAAQCSSLTAAAVQEIEQGAASPGSGAKGDCAKNLEAQAEPIAASKAVRANTLTGPIDVLRVEGDKAFALYHGTKGVNYAMPMTKEGGVWKVDSLVTQELP